MLFVRAYPRASQSMVFDAHDRAFALFRGSCGRGIYDNKETAVETIFVGKDRLHNRRFIQRAMKKSQSACGRAPIHPLPEGRGISAQFC
jgi:transposase